MNRTAELIIVGAAVAAAVAFFAVKAIGAVRGKKPSCCSDDRGPSRPSRCGGCSGCG